MSFEFVTHRNLLSFFGQWRHEVQIRHGMLRCQAAFEVPITAGAFGAVLLPLFAGLWWQGGSLKRWGLAGCLAATVVTITAGSGGPLLAYVAAVFGLLLWRFRQRLRLIRWSVILVLFGFHLVMQAPVWALIARIHVVPGASSYHRYKIIDSFVTHFSEWWLLGIQSTEDWGWLMDDVANQYGVVAKHGGLLSLLLFAWLLYLGFREIGRRLREFAEDLPTQRLLWGIGVMLFAHSVAMIDISYFDQMKIFWFTALALVGSVHLLARPEPSEASELDEAYALPEPAA